ncbi:winged helix-turn-helix domain-containing protein [Streptomyces carpinensis]|uniref:Helix-turn-helix domain-containing protein n=1 Tax=Streptomyces carpinensis TaxID=66369 RepID=A0ABV1WCH8_9ACTN|nr:helix-turn-helix domain-containing protein [Streptomyces carpinensis]
MPQEPGTPGPHAPARPAPALPTEPVELSDLATLKALSYPRRQRILQHLTRHGPATSATLARALGLNTGSTSYHLRQLARHGFVEETTKKQATHEAGGATGRERWWRAIPGDRRFPPRSRQSPEMRLVMDELNHRAYTADLELFEQAQQGGVGDDPWADAFPYSRAGIRLTLPELRMLFEEYIALLNRYRRPETSTPPDARTVLTRFFAFPAPAAADLAGHDDRDGQGPHATHTTNPPTAKRNDP